MNQAHLHSDNMEDVRERLENTVTQSSVETMYDGEDCFITVTQKNYETMNESKWSFCVDFGTNKVQMLEPTEDEESFSSDNEVFRIIKNFLNGGSSREKRMNRPDYDAGESIKIKGFGNKIGSSRKLVKSSFSLHYRNDDGEDCVWGIYDTREEAEEEIEEFKRKKMGPEPWRCEIIENSRKSIKSSNENSRYNYDFFYDKLKDSPYFEEYVVRYDDDQGEDNIHTKNIPLIITRPDGKKQTYKDAGLSFSGSGWRVSVGGWFGDSNYSDITNATIIDNRISITDSKNQEFDFFLDGNMIGSSRKSIKSGWERTDMASGPIWDKDNWRIIERREHSRNGDSVYYMLRDKDNLSKSDIRFDTLAEAMDHVDLRIQSSRKSIKSAKSVCVGFNTENGTLLWKRDDLYTLDGSTIRQTKRQDIADKWIEKYDLNTTDVRRLDRFTQEGPSQIPWGLPLVEDKDQTNYNKRLASILPPHGYNR